MKKIINILKKYGEDIFAGTILAAIVVIFILDALFGIKTISFV